MVQTPIVDFVQSYAQSGTARLHMPGHKGEPFLGCESLDITEIAGADSLYEADGIIAQSEQNATALFCSGQTLYSTEGSSQCIRAMLHLALLARAPAAKPVIVAARNVHKAFIYAAALLDFDVVWLWPETDDFSLCSCEVSSNQVERVLSGLSEPPAALYLTSPDYLGGQADIAAVAAVCRRHGVPLLVDNAHGAYLRFLPGGGHPLTLGADLCCDSAHKTLPVLTGGAYLHIAKSAPASFFENARGAMALFGSTSPSYLILQSLDLANRYLSSDYTASLFESTQKIDRLKLRMDKAGWRVKKSDPLRLVIDCADRGYTGGELAALLREKKLECEYADPDYLVMMFTPETPDEWLFALESALQGVLKRRKKSPVPRLTLQSPSRCSIRQAIFSAHRMVAAKDSVGLICASPTVGCPPAVPIVVSGEEICADALFLFERYNVTTVEVVAK